MEDKHLPVYKVGINALVQDCCNSIANPLYLL